MRDTHLTLPQLAMIAGTRAALGAGIGLLLADRMGGDQRKAVGWTLLIVGALTTIPLAIQVFDASFSVDSDGWTELSPEDVMPAYSG